MNKLKINFILTYDCNKKCSFCFSSKHSGQEMGYSDFVYHLDKIESLFGKNINVGLLGGEPLLNKDLIKIVLELQRRNICHTIFTNLLALNDEICKVIYKSIKREMINIGWNSTEDSVLSDNSLANLKHLTKIDRHAFFQSITILHDRDLIGYSHIIHNSKEYGIYRARVALDVHNHKEFMHNGKAYVIYKYLLDNGIRLSCDPCGYLLACSLTKLQYEELNNRLYSFRYGCGIGETIPVDILPDGTAIPCMPFANFVDHSVNIHNFFSVKTLIDHASDCYKLDLLNIKDRKRCEKCNECGLLNCCAGPCPALTTNKIINREMF